MKWRLAEIGNCTRGIIFIGTPHRGSEHADWLATANRFARYLGVDGNARVIESLRQGSDALDLLRDSFASLQEEYHIYTARESQKMTNIGKV